MSAIIWYLDEDVIERDLVKALRGSNLDIITAPEVEKLGYEDEQQLIWAKEENRVIYSFNVGDFCRLHRNFSEQNKIHAGIVLGQQQRYSIGEQLRGILTIMKTYSAEDMKNQLLFLSAYIHS